MGVFFRERPDRGVWTSSGQRFDWWVWTSPEKRLDGRVWTSPGKRRGGWIRTATPQQRSLRRSAPQQWPNRTTSVLQLIFAPPVYMRYYQTLSIFSLLRVAYYMVFPLNHL